MIHFCFKFCQQKVSLKIHNRHITYIFFAVFKTFKKKIILKSDRPKNDELINKQSSIINCVF
jgi:hypothetical protein